MLFGGAVECSKEYRVWRKGTEMVEVIFTSGNMIVKFGSSDQSQLEIRDSVLWLLAWLNSLRKGLLNKPKEAIRDVFREGTV